ncbi:MAG: hypothetical protein V7687_15990 [Maribacter arcticus]|uniref:hypothetical protein n=1 Tax=Maribacter arcticus TaxID=561365 RepID=UPI003002400B
MSIKFSLSILLFLGCESEDITNDIPIDDTSVLGEWLLKETYISSGGATECKM